MAFKRCFDRVVLKVSKLAYAGIYSDSEADEFSQQIQPIDSVETLITKEQIEELKRLGFDEKRFEDMAKYYKVNLVKNISYSQAEQTIKKQKKALEMANREGGNGQN